MLNRPLSFKQKIVLSIIGFFIIGASSYSVVRFQYSANTLVTPIHTLFPSTTPSPIPNPPLSIQHLFNYYSQPEYNLSTSPEDVHLFTPGDIIPARSVNNKMVLKNDFRYAYHHTASLLQKADILFINLETPFIPDCPPTVEGMIFCGSDKNIEGLVYAGVDIVGIANNHAGNHGYDAILKTISLIKENGISVTGNNEAVIKEVKGIRFGFLAYNDIGAPEEGLSWADLPAIQREVAQLKQQVDFVIVQYHWGTEYKHDPDRRQIDLAHASIDAGADLIIGNHPHWVQGTEMYKDKFITFAHGNFIFDQMWSQETREGVIGHYIFNKQGLKDVKFYPIIIEDYSQPRFANQQESEKILNDMRQASQRLH